MTIFQSILLGFLVVCAISVSFSRNLLNSILIYMSYSLIMSILWVCLESPDLAITEAAVGAGVTSILFFATLKKIQAIRIESEKAETTAAKNNDAAAQEGRKAKQKTERRNRHMSRRKPNEEYDKTMAGRFFGWLSGSKDPYLGQVEMQAQEEKVLPSETIIERMREAQMRRDKVYDPEANTLARLFHKIYTASAVFSVLHWWASCW